MTNAYHNVLYVGVTNDIVRRVAEHKAKINKGFTYKYNADKLVYFEQFNLMIDAIAREKQLKNWKREWKNALVNEDNPAWNDLSESIGVTGELVESIKAHSRRHSGFCQDPPTQKEIADQARNDGIKRGIKPEELPPDEDRKKLERRVATEEKAIEKSTQKLPKSLNKQ